MKVLVVWVLVAALGCAERALPIPPTHLAAGLDGGMPADLSVGDLALPIDLALGDLTPIPDLTMPPDLLAVCGNGRRDGLEGCDDGNTVSGDGCRADCVVEGAKRPIFKDLAGTGVWMFGLGATASGTLYIMDTMGTVLVHRVTAAGVLTKNVVPSLQINYPSRNLVAFGESLMIAGTFYSTSEIYSWDASTGVTQKLYSEYTPNGLVAFATRKLDTSYVVYANQMSEMRRVTGAASTVKYGGTAQALRLLFRPSDGRLLSLVNDSVYVDDGNGTFSRLRQLAAAQNDVFLSMTADGEGNVYVACWNGALLTCDTASVWAISPDGSEVRPFVDNFAPMGELTWDPAANHLVIAPMNGLSVIEPTLIRIPLAR